MLKTLLIGVAIILVGIAAGAWGSTFLSSYEECDASYDKRYANPDNADAQHMSERTTLKEVRAFFFCEGEVLHQNDGIITAFATLVIAGFTFTLWRTNSQQLIHARKVDRAYFAGGGECVRDVARGKFIPDANGNKQFRFEVGNHGKTPAYMYGYEIDFCTQIEAVGKPRPNIAWREHNDQFPPGQTSRPTGPLIPITRGADDVAFGAVFYRDVWGDEHFTRFILRIDPVSGQTFSDMRNVPTYRGQD